MDPREGMDRIIAVWDKCSKVAADYGMNLTWEFEPGFLFNKPSEVLKIVDAVKSRGNPNFGVMYDTCHAHMCAAVGANQAGQKETLHKLAVALEEQRSIWRAQVQTAQVSVEQAEKQLKNCTMKAPTTGIILSKKAELRLEQRRREAEQRLTDVREAVETELGVVPRRAYWALAILAGAGGFALGMKGLRQKRRKKLRTKGS